MARETKGQNESAEAVAGGENPAAVTPVLSGTGGEKADACLDDQQALIVGQRHHLHEELKQPKFGIWEKRQCVRPQLATLVDKHALCSEPS
jgi:hypothetical protein